MSHDADTPKDVRSAGGETGGMLDARRKRMLYRCQHRGMKEMDILLGGYAKDHLAGLDDAQLDELELLMDVSDQDLFKWMIGSGAVPAEHDTPLYRAIVSYKRDLIASAR
jgi:antitoxin CptB